MTYLRPRPVQGVGEATGNTTIVANMPRLSAITLDIMNAWRRQRAWKAPRQPFRLSSFTYHSTLHDDNHAHCREHTGKYGKKERHFFVRGRGLGTEQDRTQQKANNAIGNNHQIRHWIHHIRVFHQRAHSFPSMLPSPRCQPRSVTITKMLFPDILASIPVFCAGNDLQETHLPGHTVYGGIRYRHRTSLTSDLSNWVSAVCVVIDTHLPGALAVVLPADDPADPWLRQ